MRTLVLLFVYGTLRRGEVAHGQLRGARFVGEAVTDACYALADLGEYPALLEGGHCAVTGELFEVDEGLLPALDDYEDAPALYQRKPIRIAGHTAIGYVLRPEHGQRRQLIESGDWRLRKR